MNEPKLEIVEVPDERIPTLEQDRRDKDLYWLILGDPTSDSPAREVLQAGDLVVIENEQAVDVVRKRHKQALRKHLNEGMEEVWAVKFSSGNIHYDNEHYTEQEVREKAAVLSHMQPDCQAIRILVSAEPGE